MIRVRFLVMNKRFSLCACGLLLTGLSCFGWVSASEPNAVTVESLITQAETLYAEAQEREHAWLATRHSIVEARAALSAGQLDTAMSAAERALYAAQASLNQADRERSAWPERVPQ